MKKMFKSTKGVLVNVFILIACLGFILPSTVLAASGNDGQITAQLLAAGDNSEILQVQKEVDTYIFETHAKDIEKKGFKVTHTSPLKDYVEVGIVPFNQANADFLYGIFGKDKIKVVMGQEALLLTGEVKTTSATITSAKTTSSPEEKAESNSSFALVFIAAGVVLVGGILFMMRKQKPTK